MNVTVNEVDQHKVTLHIEVPAKDASKQAAAACKNLASRVNIPGFRKGKAPRKIVEQHVGKQAILDEAFEIVFPQVYGEALEEQKIDPVTRPSVDMVTLEAGKDLVFKVTVTEKPELKLGDYKGLKVEKKTAEVSDDDVQQQLVHMLDRQADMVEAEDGAAVQASSFITLDFKGFVDDEAFEGGEGKDYPLQIGSHSFIPGFEEQLIGAKIGEEKDVKVTFPAEYHAAELAGKESLFKCTVRSIKEKVVPAMDDDFAKKASTFQTLDELKADVRQKLEKSAADKVERENKDAIMQLASDNATVDIPEVMVDNRVTSMIQELSLRVEQQGMKLEQYLQYTGMDIAKIRESYREAAEKNVKMDLMLEQVAKAEEIKVEAADLDAEVEAMAKTYGATPEQVKKIIAQQGRLGDLAATVLRRKTAQFIVDNAAE